MKRIVVPLVLMLTVACCCRAVEPQVTGSDLTPIEKSEINKLIQAVADYRRAIKSGEVGIGSVDWALGGKTDELTITRSVRFRMTFDEDKLRTTTTSGRAKDTFEAFAREDAIHNDGVIFLRIFDLNDSKAKISVRFTKQNNGPSWHRLKVHVVDPRVFGLFPAQFGTMHAFSLDEFVSGVPASATLVDQELDGKPVKVITFSRRQWTTRYWINPTQGPGIVRAEMLVGDSTRVLMNCRLESIDGIWYPKEVTCEQFDETGRLGEKNRARVITARLNQPIEASTFELSGLQLDRGTLVIDDDNPRNVNGIWNGYELVE